MSSPPAHIDPKSFHHKFVTTCGYKYHYVEEGDPKGEPLLLVHGFPDLWYGWRHQIGFLAKLGYRVLVVDTLGYGQTEAPQDLQAYGLKSICDQLAGFLDALDIPKVTLIGHDWGGAIVWRFGLYYPNRLHGIISICTPYHPPATAYRSLEEIVKLVPEFEYQLNLANPETVAKMDLAVDAVLGNVLAMENLNDQDLEYIVSQFKHSTFRGPLNYYKTTRVNFDDERSVVDQNNINLPTWIILAENDMFLKPHMAAKMKDFIPQLKTTSISASHFVMVEKPDETNKALQSCLEDLQQRRLKKAVL